MNIRFLFTCGGTAGHINPALAVAGRLRELLPDCDCLFVGAEGNMEAKLVPQAGYRLETIRITNLQRSLSLSGIAHNLKTVKNLAVSMPAAGRILKAFRPDVAVGTGGYVCYPVLRKAGRQGVPTVLHESNAVPGLTTRLLAGRVTRMLVGLRDSEGAYKSRQNVCFTGTPVRGAFLSLTKEKARAALGRTGDTPLVVSFWGSLGASNMNRIMEQFFAAAQGRQAFDHIHATGGGEEGCARMKDRLRACGVPERTGVDIRPYIHDMPTVMAAADLILCRAGASTLSELAVLGKPVILVPSPYVTNNHQEKNARLMEEKGAAILVKEETCSGEELYRTVTGLLADKARLADMGRRMEGLGNRDAVDRIVEIILGLCHKC